MVIELEPALESALNEQAQKQGIAPEFLALNALRQRFLPHKLPFEPRDEWERRLLSIAKHSGVSLSNEAVSSEGIYD